MKEQLLSGTHPVPRPDEAVAGACNYSDFPLTLITLKSSRETEEPVTPAVGGLCTGSHFKDSSLTGTTND